MKISANKIDPIQKNNQQSPQKEVGFKGVGTPLVNAIGGTMQWIENQGFLATFLIQDGLGMTAPRVTAGFLRDKEVTGEYNMQEGFEVLGREGLTGPCMMAVAPAAFAIAALAGKSTMTNTALIKRFGNSLKEFVSNSNFDKNLLKNKEEMKNLYIKSNVEKMLEETLGKENVSKESIDFIMKEIANYQKIPTNVKLDKINGKGKYRASCLNNITEHIDNLLYKTSDNLTDLGKVKIGINGKNIDKFSTKSAIEGLIKYSEDAITNNKNLNNLDSISAENLKDSTVAKRFITNISTMGATLGVLSILPKIYARNSVAPGARTAMQLKAQSENNNNNIESKEISFKAGKKPKKSILSKFGKSLDKYTNNKFVTKELEYNGHNFTNSLMAGLSLFGLLTPRGMRAYERAQVDENGKKDLTELYEILIRDISSSLAVVFAVPMLTRAFVSSYENKTGFVLMNKERGKSKLHNVLDLLNPYGKSQVLSSNEIQALYNNIDSKEKMLNFCKFIDKNNGDLEKILSKSENIKLFEEMGLNLKEISQITSKQEKNTKIKEFVEKLGKESNETISKVMKNSSKPKLNKIMSTAKHLNSIPCAIATFLISPYLLGWFIPRLTYENTRRLHEKAENERKSKISTAI